MGLGAAVRIIVGIEPLNQCTDVKVSAGRDTLKQGVARGADRATIIKLDPGSNLTPPP